MKCECDGGGVKCESGMIRDVHVGVKSDDGRMATIPSCLLKS